MAGGLSIPRHAGELTAGWLTDALRKGRVITHARVESFASEALGEGAGFIGDLARVTLTYDAQEDGAPRTLIAKFPTAVDENQASGELFGLYDREIRFYDELANDVPLRKPVRYFSAMDSEQASAGVVKSVLRRLPPNLVLKLLPWLSKRAKPRRYVVLIEDMAPARVGDQVAGCSVEDATLALGEVATMHARFWNDPRIADIDWIDALNQDVKLVQAMYAEALGPFRRGFGERLPQRAHDISDWLLENGIELLNRLSADPFTLIHGDFRPDNLFFGDGKTDYPVAVIDWQSPARGSPLYDVAYFITWGINVEDHDAIPALLRGYHDTLVEHGVAGYSFEQCERDFVLARLMVMHRSVFLTGRLDLSHERGRALVEATLTRSTASLPERDLSTVFD